MKCLKKHKAKIFLTGLFFVAAVLLLLAGSASADQVDVKWDGGGGTNFWNNANNWDPNVIPNNNANTYNVFIGGSSLPDYTVYVTTGPTIDNLTIDTADSLTINNGGGINLESGASAGTITNNGTILINGSGVATTLRFYGNTTLTGTGFLNLSNFMQNTITGVSGAILTNDTNHTIQGSGNLGMARLGIINNGKILANQSQGLQIYPESAGVINNNMMQANGGILILYDGTFTNNNIIEALNGSEVRLMGATIVGGNLNTNGGGKFRVPTPSKAYLNGITLNGDFIADNGSITYFYPGTITNNGTILINGSSLATSLYLQGNTTLTGTGVLNLSNFVQNSIIGELGAILTNDTNHTIQGSGQLGFNRLGIINNGTILANQSVGLTINPYEGSFTNNGTIRVNSGSTLTVNDNLTNLSGNTLTGGTYYVVGTMRLPGAINTNAASIILDGTGSNLYNGVIGTNNALANFATNSSVGSFSILNSRNFNTAGNLNNSGAITIGSGSTLNVNGSYNQSSTGSLSGAGTLISNAIMNSGTLSGSTTLVGNVTNEGTVSPGASPGILNITGDYAQTAFGVLKIDIGGLTPGDDYDRLIISGLASLAGELNVSMFGNFMPNNGNYFDILFANDISGEFNKYDFPIFPSGFFNISYNLSPNDLDFVRLTYVSTGPEPIPEPATLLLLGSGLIGLAGYGRKKFFKN